MNYDQYKAYLEDVMRKALRDKLGTIDPAGEKKLDLNYYGRKLPHTLISIELLPGGSIEVFTTVEDGGETITTNDPFCEFDNAEMEAILEAAGVPFVKMPEKGITPEAARLWMALCYPVTVTVDRYGGTYSGAPWLAFPEQPGDIPADVFGEDGECAMFWEGYKGLVGRGHTVKQAFEDLVMQVNKIAQSESTTHD